MQHIDKEWLKDTFEQNGYCIITPFLSEPQRLGLLATLQDIYTNAAITEKNTSVYGVRDVLRKAPGLREFVRSEPIRNLVGNLLDSPAEMVKAIYFDKTKDANWKVTWHQDCTIAVRARVEMAGFEAWTVKSGVTHVRPPAEYMNRMVTLRIHLDACDESNGAIKVIPGSHHERRADSEAIKLAASSKHVICAVPAGGIMVMKPLLVHSSSAGSNPSHRRVLHLEFSPDQLPGNLEWYEAA